MNGGRGASKCLYVITSYTILYYTIWYYSILYNTILYYTTWRSEVVREGEKEGCKEGGGEARRKGKGGL
jgi:hypothetical protein